ALPDWIYLRVAPPPRGRIPSKCNYGLKEKVLNSNLGRLDFIFGPCTVHTHAVLPGFSLPVAELLKGTQRMTNGNVIPHGMVRRTARTGLASKPCSFKGSAINS